MTNHAVTDLSVLDYFFSRRALARTGGEANPFLLYRRRRSRRLPRLAFQVYLEATLLFLAFGISFYPFFRSGWWLFLFAYVLQRYYLFVNNPTGQARLLRRDALEGLYVTPLGPREFLLEPFLSCRFPLRFLVALFLVVGVSDAVAFGSGADLDAWPIQLPSLIPFGVLALSTSLTGHAHFVIEWRLFLGRPLLVVRRMFSWWVSFIAASFCSGLVFRMADLNMAWCALTVVGVALGGAWCVCRLALAVVSDGVDYLWKPIARRDPDWMNGRPPRDWGLLRTARALLIPRNPFRRRKPLPDTDLSNAEPPRLWRWVASLVFAVAFNFAFLASFHWVLRFLNVGTDGKSIAPGSPGLLRKFILNAFLFPLPMLSLLVFFRVRRFIRARRPPNLAGVFGVWTTQAFWVCVALALFQTVLTWTGKDLAAVIAYGRATFPFLAISFTLLYQSHWLLILTAGLYGGFFSEPERVGARTLVLLVLQAFLLGTVLSLLWDGFYLTVSGSIVSFLRVSGLAPPAGTFGAFAQTQFLLSIIYLATILFCLLAIKTRLARLGSHSGGAADTARGERRVLSAAASSDVDTG